MHKHAAFLRHNLEPNSDGVPKSGCTLYLNSLVPKPGRGQRSGWTPSPTQSFSYMTRNSKLQAQQRKSMHSGTDQANEVGDLGSCAPATSNTANNREQTDSSEYGMKSTRANQHVDKESKDNVKENNSTARAVWIPIETAFQTNVNLPDGAAAPCIYSSQTANNEFMDNPSRNCSIDMAPYTLDVCKRAAVISETRAERRRIFLEQLTKMMEEMRRNFELGCEAAIKSMRDDG